MICWRCHSNNINTESRLPNFPDVKTRKRRNVVGIDMIRNNRFDFYLNYRLMSSLLIFKCSTNICHMLQRNIHWKHMFVICFDGWTLTLFVLTPCRFLHFRKYNWHRDLGVFFNNGPTILILIVGVRIYDIFL